MMRKDKVGEWMVKILAILIVIFMIAAAFVVIFY